MFNSTDEVETAVRKYKIDEILNNQTLKYSEYIVIKHTFEYMIQKKNVLDQEYKSSCPIFVLSNKMSSFLKENGLNIKNTRFLIPVIVKELYPHIKVDTFTFFFYDNDADWL